MNYITWNGASEKALAVILRRIDGKLDYIIVLLERLIVLLLQLLNRQNSDSARYDLYDDASSPHALYLSIRQLVDEGVIAVGNNDVSRHIYSVMIRKGKGNITRTLKVIITHLDKRCFVSGGSRRRQKAFLKYDVEYHLAAIIGYDYDDASQRNRFRSNLAYAMAHLNDRAKM